MRRALLAFGIGLLTGACGERQPAATLPFVAGLPALDGRATAYVCENYACQLPTQDPTLLARQLGGVTAAE